MKDKLFDYVERDNWVFNLSGVSKLICFIILTVAVMYTFDVRLIVFILALCIWVLYASGIKFSQIKVLTYYVGVFLLMNFGLTYLFDPDYGVELYGSCHEIFRPRIREAFFAYHTPRMRCLTCPKCGRKGLCVEVYAEKEDQKNG